MRPVLQFQSPGGRNSHNRLAAFVLSLLAGILIISSFSGCATPVPITRVVHVVHTRYVPIPPEFLTPCPQAPLPATATNGDLANAYLHQRQSIETCNSQLRAIRNIKPPPSRT